MGMTRFGFIVDRDWHKLAYFLAIRDAIGRKDNKDLIGEIVRSTWSSCVDYFIYGWTVYFALMADCYKRLLGTEVLVGMITAYQLPKRSVGDRVMLNSVALERCNSLWEKGKLAPRNYGREIKSLKRSRISLVKVRWNSKRGPEFTWEREDYMKSKYPQLFFERTKTDESAS
ncbi:hypothetical protein Tco_0251691 [Tanacetum coccineum]